MKKTKVVMTVNSSDEDYVIGDTGVIDAYVTAKNGYPHAVVFLDKNDRAVLVHVYHMKLMNKGTGE